MIVVTGRAGQRSNRLTVAAHAMVVAITVELSTYEGLFDTIVRLGIGYDALRPVGIGSSIRFDGEICLHGESGFS